MQTKLNGKDFLIDLLGAMIKKFNFYGYQLFTRVETNLLINETIRMPSVASEQQQLFSTQG